MIERGRPYHVHSDIVDSVDSDDSVDFYPALPAPFLHIIQEGELVYLADHAGNRAEEQWFDSADDARKFVRYIESCEPANQRAQFAIWHGALHYVKVYSPQARHGDRGNA